MTKLRSVPWRWNRKLSVPVHAVNKIRPTRKQEWKAQRDNGQRLGCNSRQAEIPCEYQASCRSVRSRRHSGNIQRRNWLYSPDQGDWDFCNAIGNIHNSHGHYLELAVTSECLSERLFVRVSRRPISSAHEGRKSPIWLTLCGFRGPLMKAKRYSFWRRM